MKNSFIYGDNNKKELYTEKKKGVRKAVADLEIVFVDEHDHSSGFLRPVHLHDDFPSSYSFNLSVHRENFNASEKITATVVNSKKFSSIYILAKLLSSSNFYLEKIGR